MKLKYKAMLQGMQDKEKTSTIEKNEPWFLYILECKDGSLYTGITKDLTRRFKMHNDGKASRYTRTRLPVKLLYTENCISRTQALIRECAIKAFSRDKKDELIKACA
jgi:predicted GIY-YIG superfamily endonuclease